MPLVFPEAEITLNIFFVFICGHLIRLKKGLTHFSTKQKNVSTWHMEINTYITHFTYLGLEMRNPRVWHLNKHCIVDRTTRSQSGKRPQHLASPTYTQRRILLYHLSEKWPVSSFMKTSSEGLFILWSVPLICLVHAAHLPRPILCSNAVRWFCRLTTNVYVSPSRLASSVPAPSFSGHYLSQFSWSPYSLESHLKPGGLAALSWNTMKLLIVS